MRACRGLSFPLNTFFVLSRHLSWSILNFFLDYKDKITRICIWVEAINYAFLICHVMWHWSLCQIVCVWLIQKEDFPCPVVGFCCCCFQLGYAMWVTINVHSMFLFTHTRLFEWMHLMAGLEHKFILLFQITFSVSNKTKNTKDIKAENLYGNSSIFFVSKETEFSSKWHKCNII